MISYNPHKCDYGPMRMTWPVGSDVEWEFLSPAETGITYLLHIAGGKGYSFAQQEQLCKGVQMVAARKFQAEAQRAISRAQAARKAVADERERAAALKRAEQQRKADLARAERAQLEAQKREQEERLDAEQQVRWRLGEEQRRVEREAIEARMARLNAPIPLEPHEGKIVIGTDIADGLDITVPAKMQHTLVVGTTGSGKSVFLHQIVYQLLRSADVERTILIDLKGGTEFYAYRDMPKAEIVWAFPDVVRVIDGVMAMMTARQDELRQRSLRDWPDGRVFIVIDEYGDIQWELDNASTREEKDAAKRLASNLRAISRRARSLGIILVCALQKPTTDAMDSAVRTNLNLRICFRVSRLLAASVLDELEELPVNPPDLQTGRFIYYDANRGHRAHLQAQIAPGVVLGDET
jgi:hypothetical protein